MKHLKKILVIAGALIFLTGLQLQNVPEEKELWEKIPDEEISDDFEEEEQTEDMAVDELIPHTRYAEVRQTPEGIYQKAGEVNEFSYKDAQLLMKIAQAEAGNQGVDGMWLVMSVVLNRVSSSEYPNSIAKVIYQSHQFSSVTDGHFDDQTVLRSETHEALARIESGSVAEKILAFENSHSKELDKYYAEAFTYRDHKFYTKGD